MRKIIKTVSAVLLTAAIAITQSACSNTRDIQSDASASSASLESAENSQVPETKTHSDGPAIWEATDPETGNSIYLLGSIHVADDSIYPMNKTIMNAYKSCEALAVEVDLVSYVDDLDAQVAQFDYMFYADGGNIYDEIDAELVDKAKEIIQNSGEELGGEFQDDMYQIFRPHSWVSLLDNIAADKAGLNADKGVDMYFLHKAKEDKKEIIEIESMDSQMELLAGSPVEIQTLLLENAIDVDSSAQSLTELYNKWKSGDIEALLDEEYDEEDELDESTAALMEEYNQNMVVDRNNHMSRVAEDFLLEGKKVFYVVGAMHMIDDTGIVQQLTDMGFDVKRI